MREPLFLEDLITEETHLSGSVTITAEAIKEFATLYDPQPFHLDEQAAKVTVFGELVASGWHTASLVMRLRVTSDLELAGGWVGLGIDELSWPNPTRPGDTITAESQILEARKSKSKPGWGVIKVRTLAYNQRREVVLVLTSSQLVQSRL